jgi:Na+-transporting NADH:ubiquinone oxidoreductase subunit NqrD
VLLIISRPRNLFPNSLNEDLVSILIIRNQLVNYMFYEISTQHSTFNGIKILRGVYQHCLFYIMKTEDW